MPNGLWHYRDQSHGPELDLAGYHVDATDGSIGKFGSSRNRSFTQAPSAIMMALVGSLNAASDAGNRNGTRLKPACSSLCRLCA